jgi:uncharacterized phiE125 gp8 family phage protein
MRFTLDIAALPAGYGEAVLPLADAKAHLHVLEDDDDDLIEALRDAAVEMVEQYTGVILNPRVGDDALTWRAECLRAGRGVVSLGVGPVTGIVSATWLDAAGDEQEVDVSLLRIVDQRGIAPRPGSSWPTGVAGGAVIRFEAGLEAAPAPLVTAAKMFLATLYRHRETVVTTGVVEEVPHGFAMLCRPYRRIHV